jgi:hypothetical protein
MNYGLKKDLTYGIIVGSDDQLEKLLPYFYLNLRLNCDLPIVFFDFGMTETGKEFCQKRGEVIKIENSLFMDHCEHTLNDLKIVWFKKPLAFQKAPFDINLWLDIDCKVVSSLEPLLQAYETTKWLAIHEEVFETKKCETYKKVLKDYKDYNSGVVVFKKNSPFIDYWIEVSQKHAKTLYGDQDSLSIVLMNNQNVISSISNQWNHLFMNNLNLTFRNTAIIHYHGKSKKILYHEWDRLISKNFENFYLEKTIMCSSYYHKAFFKSCQGINYHNFDGLKAPDSRSFFDQISS